MAEAADQSKTLVSPGLAYDDAVLLNEEGGKRSGNATVKRLGDTQNGEGAGEKFEDNSLIQAQVVNEVPEPPIAEFWGKYGDNVDGDDDGKENEDSDLIENGVGRNAEEKSINFDDILRGGETGEGFNGSGAVGIEAPVIEKLSEPLNVELSAKDIEEQCRSFDGNGKSEDGPGKNVCNENGISIHVNLPINNDGETCAGKFFSDSDPTKLLNELRSIAKGNPVESMLELTGLQSYLSGFFRYNGGKELAFYQEVVGMEGLEEQTENLSGQSVMQRCFGLSENNLSGTRKRKGKSVAKQVKEGINVKSVNNGGDEDGSGLEEAASDTTGSRKRKKSKYMCDPYTDLKNLDAHIFTPKRRDYSEEEPEKITKSASFGERMKIAAAKLLGTSPKKKDGHASAALSVYEDGSSKTSSFEISMGVGEEQKETTLAEFIREKKKELERAKKANNEGLDYIKEKLQKMSSMVENCEGGYVSSELKASLKTEANELLEKISAMAA